MIVIVVLDRYSVCEVESLIFNIITAQKAPETSVEVVVEKGNQQYAHALSVHRTVSQMAKLVSKVSGRVFEFNVKVLLK